MRVTASKGGASFADRVVAHVLLMAPFGWLVAAGAATLGEILPSMAARSALGYGKLPYDFGSTFARMVRFGTSLPYFLAIVLGTALICAVREERDTSKEAAGLVASLFAWAFLVQYVAQGFLYFTFQREVAASWAAAFAVTLLAATLYAATSLAALPFRTRLCDLVTR